MYLNRSLNIFSNGPVEIIPLKPKTYILRSLLHLGILSFDQNCCEKWILSFCDEQSALSCATTLKTNGLTVADIQQLIYEKNQLENTIIKTITNVDFAQFVAQVEDSMKNKSDHQN